MGFGVLALEDLMKGMSSEAPRPLIQGHSKVHSISIKKEQLFTSVAMVTSQKLFSSLRCLKEATMLVWKSFQRRQNCCSSVIFGLVLQVFTDSHSVDLEL